MKKTSVTACFFVYTDGVWEHVVKTNYIYAVKHTAE